MRKSIIIQTLLAANLLLVPVAIVHGLPRNNDDALTMPYQAELFDADGNVVDGTYTIGIRLLSDDGANAKLLYGETFAGHVVEDGALTLLLGAGEPTDETLGLTAEDLWEHSKAVLEVTVDGEVLGPPQRLGKVPHAITARRVPAQGIRYGDGHGQVPAEALEPHVKMIQGIYAPGEHVEDLPASSQGWECEHSVTPAGPGFERDRLNAQDLFVGQVGPGSVAPAPDLIVEFGNPGGLQQPGIDPSTEVFYVHAWSGCTADAWAPACWWQQAPAPAGQRVLVTSMCTRF